MSILQQIKNELIETKTTLVAVSKTKPCSEIEKLYHEGQRIFGENKVQELVEKYEQLPKDIEWHLIGHLQTNKVKYIASFVSLIHSVDSIKLIDEIQKQAQKNNRTIPVLLQMYIAKEETKFGLNQKEAIELIETILAQPTFYTNIKIVGIMGMASFSTIESQIRKEFASLKDIFVFLKQSYFLNKKEFTEISMGMSNDYHIAIEEGSTMVRIGSLLFGNRN